jgi:hypothetical protein
MEVVEQPDYVVDHLGAEAGTLGEPAALAVPAKVESDHAVVYGERVADLYPILQAARGPVKQHRRRAAARLTVAQPYITATKKRSSAFASVDAGRGAERTAAVPRSMAGDRDAQPIRTAATRTTIGLRRS